MAFKLYKHQKTALDYMRMFPHFALFMEQGCGKTLPCLVRALELCREGSVKSALVVAPKATMGAWERDMGKFSKGDREELQALFTVVNYEAVWRGTDLDGNAKGGGGKYDKAYDLVILDESHKIKNRTSKQAQMCLRLGLRAKFRYILTGTPICNGRLEDIWAQYCFLAPYQGKRSICSSIFGGSYNDFINKYAVLDQWFKPRKYVCVNELQDIIDTFSYRVTKKECLDLPEKLPDDIWTCELKDSKHYRELHNCSTMEEYDYVADNGLERMLRLRQFCSGFLVFGSQTIDIPNEKETLLKELLESWPRDKKIVIFAEFRHSITTIERILDECGIKRVTLDGRQKNKDIWRKFQNDGPTKAIVCQYRSASNGIDLYAADTIVYYEPTLSSNVLEQSRDRIHRIGQKSKCSYIHFVTRGTVEEAIYSALKNYCDFDERLFTEYMETYFRGEKKK